MTMYHFVKNSWFVWPSKVEIVLWWECLVIVLCTGFQWSQLNWENSISCVAFTHTYKHTCIVPTLFERLWFIEKSGTSNVYTSLILLWKVYQSTCRGFLRGLVNIYELYSSTNLYINWYRLKNTILVKSQIWPIT